MTKKVIETTNGWYMENEKEKVELEDIVGLIKTDEPTDSVQLKKEAQLSICEKRVLELEKENEQLKREIGKQQEEIEILSEENKELKRDRLENYKAYKKLLNENEELKEAMKRMMIDMMGGNP